MSDTPIYDQLCAIYGALGAHHERDPSDLDTVELDILVLPGMGREGRAGSGGSGMQGRDWFEQGSLSRPQFPWPSERPHSR
ncbi:MAG: hypothetical protein ACRDSP_00230 [Pseudonocardiaceae bacterium]